MSDPGAAAYEVGALLGPKPKASELLPLPKASELLPESQDQAYRGYDPQFTPLDGPTFDKMFSEGQPGHILNLFFQGAAQGWGTKRLAEELDTKTLDPATGERKSAADWLRENGLWNDFEKGQSNVFRSFNESLMRSTAVGLDMLFRRAPGVVIGGAANVVPGFGALVEAFPGGHLTGFPIPVMPRGTLPHLEEAARLGLLDEKSPARVAREALAPDQTRPPTEAATLSELPPDFVPPGETAPDVHSIARQIAPETFDRYDALDAQRQELQSMLSEIDPAVEGYNIAGKKVLERDIAALDKEIADLAPEVTRAYQEAQRSLPSEPTAEIVPFPEPTPREVRNLAQRGPSIARTVENQLREVGQSVAEARANAAIVQAYYETRAQRLGGDATGRDLFDQDAPQIAQDLKNDTRNNAAFNIASNTITLFRNANASTFLHESAHTWLTQMLADAEHPRATADLKADVETLRTELGDLTQRGPQERFARGFERYLMEGVAPSRGLAKVFEQFKDWLTKIYRVLSGIPNSRINDEIRGVYDRLLSRPSGEPVIAAERGRPASFADDHEAVAREAPTEVAEPVADRMRDDRDRMAEIIQESIDAAKREVFGGRRIAARGPARTRVPERGEPTGESIAAGEGVAPAAETVSEGRNPPSGKSETPATGASFDPVDLPLVDKAGNIRLDNLNLPEDVKQALRENAAIHAGFTEARRGVLSDAEVNDLANAMGMDPKMLDRRKIGEAFSAEQIRAAIKLLEDMPTRLRDAAAKAVSSDEGVLEYATERARLLMIQEQISGIAAEAGRALRAFRNISGKLEIGLLNDLFQSTIGRTVDDLRQEAAHALTLRTTPEVNKFNRDMSKPDWKDKVGEIYTASIFSGEWTQIFNVVGSFRSFVDSIIEPAVASVGGNVPLTVAYDNARAIYTGFTRATAKAWEVLRNEDLIGEANRPIQVRHMKAVGGTTGKIVRLAFRGMAAADTWFKTIADEQKLHELGRLQATAEGLTGDAFGARLHELVTNPPEEWTKAREAWTNYQTFTTPLGPRARGFQQMLGNSLLGRFLFPVIRTSINLAKYELERDALGLASKEVRGRMFGSDLYVRDMQIARLAVGTAVMGAIIYQAFGGNDPSEADMTGGGPLDPGEFAVWRDKGFVPYAKKIGGTYYTYRNILPGAATAMILTDLVQAVRLSRKVEQDKIDRVYWGLLLNLSRDLTNTLPLRSLSGMIAAGVDPERYGPQFAQQASGSIVPAFIAQPSAWADPVLRDSRGIVDNLIARTPASTTLPEMIGPWGQPIMKREQGVLRHDPIDDELTRLGMGPAKPSRKIEDIDLTPQQYHDYRALSGSLARQFLEAMIDGEGWNTVPDGMKRELIGKQIEASRRIARTYIKGESYGTDNDIISQSLEKKSEKLR